MPNILKTRICSLLNIEFPILQAGMGQVARGRLAAAVSQAGGLGVIGSAYMTAEELRREIHYVRSVTDKPFGVDILFGKVNGEDPVSMRYNREIESLIQVTLEERVPVLISGLGNPVGVIAEAHKRGMVVMSVVGNVRQALKLVREGVDAVIASGCEGGGHVGRIGTMALIPQVVDAVDVPVVAGGGLADGRGLVAALALGAEGIWMGTRFIATEEAFAHQNYKNKIVEIDGEGTVVTRAHSGKPVRMIRNRFTEEWERRSSEIQPYPLQLMNVGERAAILGRVEGDVDHGVLPAGQSSGLIGDIKPAAEVVRDTIREANAVLRRWQCVPFEDESVRSAGDQKFFDCSGEPF
ncbi:MAG: nitronate monooxygenase [Alicyclobacillaceae bacterium]|nr:nitronate monooxygenase [Alicyclobacillaceae bacterium]